MLFTPKINTIVLAVFALSLVACNKEDASDPTANNWSWESPAHFPEPVFKFDKLAYTEESFRLGKQLFFDPILSRDNSISCGSCHHQDYAFSDPGKPFSEGVDGQLSTRNSPALINLAWQTNFMWDGGINHLDLVPFAPITNELEMDENLKTVIAKLASDADYNKQFQQVYGDSLIDGQRILLAITHYMVALVSSDAKYDQYISGQTTFNESELKGYELFTKHCGSCHTEPLFHSNEYANNGLDSTFSDVGRYLITLNPSDSGKFKIPTLRNITLTAPYMYDGRYNSLEEVMNHYRFGIQSSKTLSSDIPKKGFTLSDEESDAIIAFLETLTDEVFVTEERFQP